MGLLCVVFFSVLSIPFMRWGVSLLGAASGGILTAGVWLALGLPQEYVWAGGLIGLIAGGMISFIVFKIAVILFTSLGGSILLAFSPPWVWASTSSTVSSRQPRTGPSKGTLGFSAPAPVEEAPARTSIDRKPEGGRC